MLAIPKSHRRASLAPVLSQRVRVDRPVPPRISGDEYFGRISDICMGGGGVQPVKESCPVKESAKVRLQSFCALNVSMLKWLETEFWQMLWVRLMA